ncbi:gamma carbonic anhydrase family protein [Bacillus sp. V2I10]|uniref:gamma carbonic anhydrase family protein n=1 Tax=Bacillus sp. V2I10 TaxID=3042276 RepID=UPI002786727A|nr:gamma carbonic anhydrase family protein [Bacillus sp. V2I10]MDQ0862119.1 carbonic anhydrase/acetyltransferase-like protein (isoleucine patch superfamily) [Bacillus sp. V2I10]
MIHGLRGKVPSIHSETFIHESAQIIGDVRIAKDVSIWPQAVLRGDDNNFIEIGDGSNIQDGCIGHVTPEFPLHIGKMVTVGHGAILHACKIEDGALIGIGAIVLDGAVVRKGAQVGAGAVVPPGRIIPEGALAIGIPAKVVKELTEEEKNENIHNAMEYIELWNRDYK